MQFSLDHVSLRVSNLEATARFYMEVLGLEEIENGTGTEGIRWFGISGKESVHISRGDLATTRVTKSNHLALRTPDLDMTMAELTARNVRFFDWAGEEGRPTLRPDGVRQIYIQDPDGYWIEINDN
ncbi:MAG TPA: VOC family protein [Devosiaceae bacterium]|jgi:catechol 2,3-dioxygenase-like lactoylglutathione lyase family enzyme